MTRRERWTAWFAVTHGGLFELTRHFIGQLFAPELFSSREHLERLVVGVLTFFASVGLVLPRVYYKKYDYLSHLPAPGLYFAAVRADRLFFVALTMLIAGLATVVLWQSLFPSRRDYLVLRPLPVSLGDIFLARLFSILLVLGVLIADLLLMTCTFPLVSSGRWQHSGALQYFFAHAGACAAGALFVVFAAIALQGLLLNLLPARWFERLSLAAQILFLLGLLAAIPATFSLPNLYREIAARPWWLAYLPAAWFAALYETWLGNSDPFVLWLAGMAWRASAAALILAVATYLLSFRRYAARCAAQVTAAPGRVPGGGLWAAFGRALFPSPVQQAVFDFASATLKRSRQHKLLVSVYLGLALAFAVNSAGAFLVLRHGVLHRFERMFMTQTVLAVPFIVSLLLACGLVHAFRVPTEPRANWIFRLSDQRRTGDFLSPAGTLVTAAALLPVVVITPFATAYALGWRAAWLHTAFAATLALVMVEFKMAKWDRVPFTCSYLAGRKPFFSTAAVAILIFVLLTTIVSAIELSLLRTSSGIFLAIAALLALYAWKLRSRLLFWREIRPVFEDNPEEMFTSLAILPR